MGLEKGITERVTLEQILKERRNFRRVRSRKYSRQRGYDSIDMGIYTYVNMVHVRLASNILILWLTVKSGHGRT